MEDNVVITFIMVFFLFLVMGMTIYNIYSDNTVNTKIECKISGINYVDLSNKSGSCWSNEISVEVCPLPTDIECNFDIPYRLITRVINGET
mgnify:CR=1 FL=1